MDFIFEFIFELVLEGIFGLTVRNPKVKTWVKTVVFLLISEAFAGFFLWLSYRAPAAEPGGDLVVRIIAIALGIGFLAGAIHGHRRNWKQEI